MTGLKVESVHSILVIPPIAGLLAESESEAALALQYSGARAPSSGLSPPARRACPPSGGRGPGDLGRDDAGAIGPAGGDRGDDAVDLALHPVDLAQVGRV